ncbi:conserved hypothetical protein [Neospora caninum Liverpool]|uniref:FYVE-type domain-containing protein n=1 Tax=Neospora caninum (strain Liverpool) TaxID=572307 RepID=F0VHL8_NEOCL|nr:conserved hypothetical protein [Neospora caninum Liverpool]CBZ53212.1 conserved hypothetical protein [Neospora caninum Liverpool]|eukprot:XP_003883244.1 conserved hypothetical protein [Neospora caninum Liverpool]
MESPGVVACNISFSLARFFASNGPRRLGEYLTHGSSPAEPCCLVLLKNHACPGCKCVLTLSPAALSQFLTSSVSSSVRKCVVSRVQRRLVKRGRRGREAAATPSSSPQVGVCSPTLRLASEGYGRSSDTMTFSTVSPCSPTPEAGDSCCPRFSACSSTVRRSRSSSFLTADAPGGGEGAREDEEAKARGLTRPERDRLFSPRSSSARNPHESLPLPSASSRSRTGYDRSASPSLFTSFSSLASPLSPPDPALSSSRGAGTHQHLTPRELTPPSRFPPASVSSPSGASSSSFAAPRFVSLFFSRDPRGEGTGASGLETTGRPTDWLMPDSKCSRCFACGVSFSTFTRRHHCRQCGLVFCHKCCSCWGEGAPLGFGPGRVRVCGACSQLAQRDEEEARREQGERAAICEHEQEETEVEASEEKETQTRRALPRGVRAFTTSSSREEEERKRTRRRASQSVCLSSRSASSFSSSGPAASISSRWVPSPSAFCSAGEAAWRHLRGSVYLHCRLVGLSRLHARILFDLTLSVIAPLRLPAASPSSSPPSVFDFVKVKRLPGLSVSDSFFVHGVVFPLHLHCKQHTRLLLQRPRLLLLSSFLGLPRQYPPSASPASPGMPAGACSSLSKPSSLSSSAASFPLSEPSVSNAWPSPLASAVPQAPSPASPASLSRPPGTKDPTKETTAFGAAAQTGAGQPGVSASLPGAAYTRMQILREQEETYTGIVIQKILALEPALILTSDGASQLVQAQLQALGICLLVHVPPRTLRRVSRSSGAPILSSLDRAAALAVALREEQEKDADRRRAAEETGSARSSGDALRLTGTSQEAQPPSKRRQLPWGSCGVCQICRPQPMCVARPSLVFIARCPSRAGATICLRGRASSVLGAQAGDCACVSPEARPPSRTPTGGRGLSPPDPERSSGAEYGKKDFQRSARAAQEVPVVDELFLSKRVLQRALVHAFSLRQELTLVASCCGRESDDAPFQFLPDQLRAQPLTARGAEGAAKRETQPEKQRRFRDHPSARTPPGERATCRLCRAGKKKEPSGACWCRLTRQPVGASRAWRRGGGGAERADTGYEESEARARTECSDSGGVVAAQGCGERGRSGSREAHTSRPPAPSARQLQAKPPSAPRRRRETAQDESEQEAHPVFSGKPPSPTQAMALPFRLSPSPASTAFLSACLFFDRFLQTPLCDWLRLSFSSPLHRPSSLRLLAKLVSPQPLPVAAARRLLLTSLSDLTSLDTRRSRTLALASSSSSSFSFSSSFPLRFACRDGCALPLEGERGLQVLQAGCRFDSEGSPEGCPPFENAGERHRLGDWTAAFENAPRRSSRRGTEGDWGRRLALVAGENVECRFPVKRGGEDDDAAENPHGRERDAEAACSWELRVEKLGRGNRSPGTSETDPCASLENARDLVAFGAFCAALQFRHTRVEGRESNPPPYPSVSSPRRSSPSSLFRSFLSDPSLLGSQPSRACCGPRRLLPTRHPDAPLLEMQAALAAADLAGCSGSSADSPGAPAALDAAFAAWAQRPSAWTESEKDRLFPLAVFLGAQLGPRLRQVWPLHLLTLFRTDSAQLSLISSWSSGKQQCAAHLLRHDLPLLQLPPNREAPLSLWRKAWLQAADATNSTDKKPGGTRATSGRRPDGDAGDQREDGKAASGADAERRSWFEDACEGRSRGRRTSVAAWRDSVDEWATAGSAEGPSERFGDLALAAVLRGPEEAGWRTRERGEETEEARLPSLRDTVQKRCREAAAILHQKKCPAGSARCKRPLLQHALRMQSLDSRIVVRFSLFSPEEHFPTFALPRASSPQRLDLSSPSSASSELSTEKKSASSVAPPDTCSPDDLREESASSDLFTSSASSSSSSLPLFSSTSTTHACLSAEAVETPVPSSASEGQERRDLVARQPGAQDADRRAGQEPGPAETPLEGDGLHANGDGGGRRECEGESWLQALRRSLVFAHQPRNSDSQGYAETEAKGGAAKAACVSEPSGVGAKAGEASGRGARSGERRNLVAGSSFATGDSGGSSPDRTCEKASGRERGGRLKVGRSSKPRAQRWLHTVSTETSQSGVLFWQVCSACQALVLPCRMLGEEGNLPFSKFLELLLCNDSYRGDGSCVSVFLESPRVRLRREDRALQREKCEAALERRCEIQKETRGEEGEGEGEQCRDGGLDRTRRRRRSRCTSTDGEGQAVEQGTRRKENRHPREDGKGSDAWIPEGGGGCEDKRRSEAADGDESAEHEGKVGGGERAGERTFYFAFAGVVMSFAYEEVPIYTLRRHQLDRLRCLENPHASLLPRGEAPRASTLIGDSSRGTAVLTTDPDLPEGQSGDSRDRNSWRMKDACSNEDEASTPGTPKTRSGDPSSPSPFSASSSVSSSASSAASASAARFPSLSSPRDGSSSVLAIVHLLLCGVLLPLASEAYFASRLTSVLSLASSLAASTGGESEKRERRSLVPQLFRLPRPFIGGASSRSPSVRASQVPAASTLRPSARLFSSSDLSSPSSRSSSDASSVPVSLTTVRDTNGYTSSCRVPRSLLSATRPEPGASSCASPGGSTAHMPLGGADGDGQSRLAPVGAGRRPAACARHTVPRKRAESLEKLATGGARTPTFLDLFKTLRCLLLRLSEEEESGRPREGSGRDAAGNGRDFHRQHFAPDAVSPTDEATMLLLDLVQDILQWTVEAMEARQASRLADCEEANSPRTGRGYARKKRKDSVSLAKSASPRQPPAGMDTCVTFLAVLASLLSPLLSLCDRYIFLFFLLATADQRGVSPIPLSGSARASGTRDGPHGDCSASSWGLADSRKTQVSESHPQLVSCEEGMGAERDERNGRPPSWSPSPRPSCGIALSPPVFSQTPRGRHALRAAQAFVRLTRRAAAVYRYFARRAALLLLVSCCSTWPTARTWAPAGVRSGGAGDRRSVPRRGEPARGGGEMETRNGSDGEASAGSSNRQTQQPDSAWREATQRAIVRSRLRALEARFLCTSALPDLLLLKEGWETLRGHLFEVYRTLVADMFCVLKAATEMHTAVERDSPPEASHRTPSGQRAFGSSPQDDAERHVEALESRPGEGRSRGAPHSPEMEQTPDPEDPSPLPSFRLRSRSLSPQSEASAHQQSATRDAQSSSDKTRGEAPSETVRAAACHVDSAVSAGSSYSIVVAAKLRADPASSLVSVFLSTAAPSASGLPSALSESASESAARDPLPGPCRQDSAQRDMTRRLEAVHARLVASGREVARWEDGQRGRQAERFRHALPSASESARESALGRQSSESTGVSQAKPGGLPFLASALSPLLNLMATPPLLPRSPASSFAPSPASPALRATSTKRKGNVSDGLPPPPSLAMLDPRSGVSSEAGAASVVCSPAVASAPPSPFASFGRRVSSPSPSHAISSVALFEALPPSVALAPRRGDASRGDSEQTRHADAMRESVGTCAADTGRPDDGDGRAPQMKGDTQTEDSPDRATSQKGGREAANPQEPSALSGLKQRDSERLCQGWEGQGAASADGDLVVVMKVLPRGRGDTLEVDDSCGETVKVSPFVPPASCSSPLLQLPRSGVSATPEERARIGDDSRVPSFFRFSPSSPGMSPSSRPPPSSPFSGTSSPHKTPHNLRASPSPPGAVPVAPSPLGTNRRGGDPLVPRFFFAPSSGRRRAVSCEVLQREGERTRDCPPVPFTLVPHTVGEGHERRGRSGAPAETAVAAARRRDQSRGCSFDSPWPGDPRGEMDAADAADGDRADALLVCPVNGSGVGGTRERGQAGDGRIQFSIAASRRRPSHDARGDKEGHDQVGRIARAAPAVPTGEPTPDANAPEGTVHLGMAFALPVASPAPSSPSSPGSRRRSGFPLPRETAAAVPDSHVLFERVSAAVFDRLLEDAQLEMTRLVSSHESLLSSLHPASPPGVFTQLCFPPLARDRLPSPLSRQNVSPLLRNPQRREAFSCSRASPSFASAGVHGVWVTARDTDVGSVIAHALLSAAMQREMAARWASWGSRARARSRPERACASEESGESAEQAETLARRKSSAGDSASSSNFARTDTGPRLAASGEMRGGEPKQQRGSKGAERGVDEEEDSRKMRLPCCGGRCAACRCRRRTGSLAPRSDRVETPEETGDSEAGECDCCRGSCPVGVARLRRLHRAGAFQETAGDAGNHLWGGDCDCPRCGALRRLLQLAMHAPTDEHLATGIASSGRDWRHDAGVKGKREGDRALKTRGSRSHEGQGPVRTGGDDVDRRQKSEGHPSPSICGARTGKSLQKVHSEFHTQRFGGERGTETRLAATHSGSPSGWFLTSCFLSLPPLSAPYWRFDGVGSSPFAPLSSRFGCRLHALADPEVPGRDRPGWARHSRGGSRESSAVRSEARDSCLLQGPPSTGSGQTAHAQSGDGRGDSPETPEGLAIRWWRHGGCGGHARGERCPAVDAGHRRKRHGVGSSGPAVEPPCPSSASSCGSPACPGPFASRPELTEGERPLAETWALLRLFSGLSSETPASATNESSACASSSSHIAPVSPAAPASAAGPSSRSVQPLSARQPGHFDFVEEREGGRNSTRILEGRAVRTLRNYLRLGKSASPSRHNEACRAQASPLRACGNAKASFGWGDEERRVMREVITGPSSAMSAGCGREKEGDARHRARKGKRSFSPHGLTGEASEHVQILVQAKRGEANHEEEASQGVREQADSPCLVTVYYAARFHAMRHLLCGDDMRFCASLRTSQPVRLPGGKSGAHFSLTQDGQYIVKQLNKHEMRLLLSAEAGSALFRHFAETLFDQEPTTLTALYGVFQLAFLNTKSKAFYVVMENLRHGRAREDGFLSQLQSLSFLAPLAALLRPVAEPAGHSGVAGGRGRRAPENPVFEATGEKGEEMTRMPQHDGGDAGTTCSSASGYADEGVSVSTDASVASDSAVADTDLGCSTGRTEPFSLASRVFRLFSSFALSSFPASFQSAPASFTAPAEPSRLLLFDLKGVGTLRYVRLDDKRSPMESSPGAHGDNAEEADLDARGRAKERQENGEVSRRADCTKDAEEERDERGGRRSHGNAQTDTTDAQPFCRQSGLATHSESESGEPFFSETHTAPDRRTSAATDMTPEGISGDRRGRKAETWDISGRQTGDGEDERRGYGCESEGTAGRAGGLQGTAAGAEGTEGERDAGREEAPCWSSDQAQPSSGASVGAARPERCRRIDLEGQCEESDAKAIEKTPFGSGKSGAEWSREGPHASGKRVEDQGDRRQARKDAEASDCRTVSSQGSGEDGSETDEVVGGPLLREKDAARGDASRNLERRDRGVGTQTDVEQAAAVARLSHPPAASSPSPELPGQVEPQAPGGRFRASPLSGVVSPLFLPTFAWASPAALPPSSAPALPVLWDQNFREFSGGFPLCLDSCDHAWLWRALQRDTQLLQRLDVVDYSLLVLVEESGRVRRISVALIDFFRPYTWDKQVETIGKSLAYMTRGLLDQQPTVLSPPQYRLRFLHTMAAFFGPSHPTDLTGIFASLLRLAPALTAREGSADRDRRYPGEQGSAEGPRQSATSGNGGDTQERQARAEEADRCSASSLPADNPEGSLAASCNRCLYSVPPATSPPFSVCAASSSASPSQHFASAFDYPSETPTRRPSLDARVPSVQSAAFSASTAPGKGGPAGREREEGEDAGERLGGEACRNAHAVPVRKAERRTENATEERDARDTRIVHDVQSATAAARASAFSAFLRLRIRDQQRKDRGKRNYY